MTATATIASTSLRGMFAFALWDERSQPLFCARDRFGIKPFYYAVVGNLFVFASEAKALLPFLPEIETDPAALAEYLTFQYTIGEATLFRGIKQLLPGHALTVENGEVRVWRYWDVHYEIDFDHSQRYFERRLSSCSTIPCASICAATCRSAPMCRAASTSSLIAILAGETERGIARLLPRPLHRVSGLRRERLREAAVGRAGARLHIDRHHRARISATTSPT